MVKLCIRLILHFKGLSKCTTPGGHLGAKMTALLNKNSSYGIQHLFHFCMVSLTTYAG